MPVDGPITELHYTGGRTCHLNRQELDRRHERLPRRPALEVPVGYTPVAPPPSEAEVLAPLHVELLRRPHRGEEILVTFNSRVAITTDRSDYQVRLYAPGEPSSRYIGGMPFNTDIQAGEEVKLSAALAPGGDLKPGLYTGDVTLVYATGPALLEGPGTVYRHVGSFSIRVR